MVFRPSKKMVKFYCVLAQLKNHKKAKEAIRFFIHDPALTHSWKIRYFFFLSFFLSLSPFFLPSFLISFTHFYFLLFILYFFILFILIPSFLPSFNCFCQNNWKVLLGVQKGVKLRNIYQRKEHLRLKSRKGNKRKNEGKKFSFDKTGNFLCGKNNFPSHEICLSFVSQKGTAL